MSNDKRTVHTDALETLGTIINDKAQRDAIHLAVEPVVAGEQLLPGQHIGIENGLAFGTAKKKLGIVDPFINGIVFKGNTFWLIVYPRQISSLRHVWEHPDFPVRIGDNAFTKEESEQWLRNWCESNDSPDYETLMLIIEREGTIDGTHLHTGDNDCSASLPYEFWDHVHNVTGIEIKERPQYFSCAC